MLITFVSINTAQEKRSHMLSLVEKWRSSDQTQHEFCSFHGIKIHTLAYWIDVCKEEKPLQVLLRSYQKTIRSKRSK
ncbi:IS66 family insertion sequence element accessory protein TnpA [Sphingobacterium sp. JUb56]|uniref:IS66 family insertion sequence element accessory protein TnpA n=1 Tax=Sphingobacterium sp. JUb56 TaxID=2587145 RepID=UPI003906AAA2